MHLFFLCVLSVVIPSFAHNFGPENLKPTVTFTTYPPSSPTPSLEPTHDLSPGQRYAKREHNPFYRPGALVYGTPKVVKFTNSTQPSHNLTCVEGGDRVEKRWAKHHYDILHRNGTVQPVGFSLDIFKELELRNATTLSEITRGRDLVYGPECQCKQNKTKHDKCRDSEKRYILGPDARVQISNTWTYPFNTVGQIATGCTGTLVGPRHVLTAGHCVHSGGPAGNWYSDLNFTLTYRPGFDGKNISTKTFAWTQVWSVKGWTENADWDYDYALIILQDTETSFPWMSFGYNTGLDNGWGMNLNAFHGDQPWEIMWHSYDVITDTGNNWFDHNLDIFKGSSGGGIYSYRASTGSRIIYGVQSTQRNLTVPNFPDVLNSHTISWNRGTRINKARFWQICSWINAGIC